MAVTCKATSGNKGKFEATVKSVLIGAVPDRGGRPAEGRAAAAAASMPAWAPRSAGEVSSIPLFSQILAACALQPSFLTREA